ncbi:uncharacterized protein MONOS_10953 [Monocercomonoides exilis]|uniref:uncharacterized protein n=1 Tax=Monocercomonoides exilis TaxID=2049356 RepID=UPI0035599F9E|nr:hypothetical protein MONOS_10953 [Monocercomonoides exilis]
MSRLQRHKMPDEPNKHWVQVGSLWLKMEENKLEANLKEKQEQLSRKIDSLRNKVRDEAIKLEELQDPDTIAKHFNLKSLSKDELQSFYPSRNAF